jgi:hypothetical protein
MKVVLIIVSYVFLLLGAIKLACFQTSNIDECLKLFGYYAASLTGLYIIVITYVNVTRQAKHSIKIEERKVTIANTNNAYSELLKAMQNFYDAMNQVQQGSYSKKAAENADKLLTINSYLLERLDLECKTSFIGFHQKLRYLREKFENEKTNDKRANLWRNEIKNVTALWNEFINTVKKHHPEVANTNLSS